jgi:excisionase family DNA binding protein
MSPPAVSPRRYLSPAQVAEQLGIDVRRILGWIARGELRACNVGSRPDGGKPRWRIAQCDLDVFLLRRTASPTPTTPRRRRQPEGVTEYFR